MRKPIKEKAMKKKLSFRLGDNEYQQLLELADKYDISASTFIRIAVERFLKEWKETEEIDKFDFFKKVVKEARA